jgi:hypothetical protein
MASLNFKFRSIRSRRWVGLLLVLMGLVGCGGSVDPKATEKALKEELAKQGVGSLKEVSCPSGMKTGQKFDCTGIFESGIGFRIPVEQKGEGDKLVWEIPSIKGMLNMNQVMKTMQGELKLGDGAIDCGTASTYRMVSLGSTFECVLPLSSPVSEGKAGGKSSKDAQLAKSTDEQLDGKLDGKLPDPKESNKATTEPDKIEIAIGASGDVTWQRLIAGIAAGTPVKPKTPEADKPATDKPATDKPAADKANESSKPKSDNGKTSAAAEADVPYDS